jgi:hypothetical protein
MRPLRPIRRPARLAFLLALAAPGCVPDDRALAGRIETAIAGAVRYFEGRGLGIGRESVAMQLVLQGEHFGLGWKFPSAEELERRHPSLRGAYFKLYDRVFDDRRSIARLEPWLFVERRNIRATWAETMRTFGAAQLVEEIDIRTLWAMYCDVYPVTDSLLEAIEVAGRRGGYELSHAAWQTQYLVSNDCLDDGQTRRVGALREGYAAGLAKLVEERESQENDYDLPFEAIAFLLYMGEQERVRGEWIEYVLAAQLPEGGWPLRSGSREPDDHASMHALWALLEYRARVL